MLVRLTVDRAWPPGAATLPAGTLVSTTEEDADGLIFEGAAEPVVGGLDRPRGEW